MSRESEEKVQAGALTDGILTTSSVIFDSASRFAHLFLEDYRREYPKTTNSIRSTIITIAMIQAMKLQMDIMLPWQYFPPRNAQIPVALT